MNRLDFVQFENYLNCGWRSGKLFPGAGDVVSSAKAALVVGC